MKQAMKEMLQEFIERDFTAYEMQIFIGAIVDVEQDFKSLAIHRKRDDLDMVLKDKREIEYDLKELRDRLDEVGMTYKCMDLVDDGGVEL